MPNVANAIANVMKVLVYYSAQLITPGCANAFRKGWGMFVIRGREAEKKPSKVSMKMLLGM